MPSPPRHARSDTLSAFRAGLGAAVVAAAAAAGFAGVSALQAPETVRLDLVANDPSMQLVCAPGDARLEFRLEALAPGRPATYALRINHELFAARADWSGEAHADREGARRLLAAYTGNYVYRLRADFGPVRLDLSADEVDALNRRLADIAGACAELDPSLRPGRAGRDTPLTTAGVDPARARQDTRGNVEIEQLTPPPPAPRDGPTTPLDALRGDDWEDVFERDPVVAAGSAATPAPEVAAQTAPAAGPAAFAVQVGAFSTPAAARARLDALAAAARRFPAPPVEARVDADGALHRARYTFFSREAADAACDMLKGFEVECFAGALTRGTARTARPPATEEPAAPAIPAEAASPAAQIGAYSSEAEARAAFAAMRTTAAAFDPARYSERIMVVETERGRLFRARYVFASLAEARAACQALQAAGQDCFAVP